MKTIFFLPTEQFARYKELANMLAQSSFGVPEAYRGDVGSCLNAVDIALRLNVSPLLVLQNVRDVGGRPTLTYQFAKALIEDSGIITGGLQYEIEGELQNDGTSSAGKPYRVRAVADTPAGTKLLGPWISWHMAQLERWTENPSWISMPEVLFRARATTFFYNQHCASLLMGFGIEGDPAVVTSGSVRKASALAVASAPLEGSLGNSVPESFTAALEATPTAQVIVAATPAVGEQQAAPQESNAGAQPSDMVGPGPQEPKPRGKRGGRVAAQASQAAPAKDASHQAGGGEPVAESQFGPVHTESTNPSEPIVDFLDMAAETSSGQDLVGDTKVDDFSIAFSIVDATKPTGESLRTSMEIVQRAQGDAAEDLCLVLMDKVVSHLTSLMGSNRRLNQEECDFASHVRELYAATRETGPGNHDLSVKRSLVHSTYVSFLQHLQKMKTPALV